VKLSGGHRRRVDRDCQRGFTLLELLVSIVITTIGLSGLLALHTAVARGNAGADRANEAMTIASQTLESLRAQRTDDMMVTLTGSSASVPPQTVSLSTSTGRNNVTYTRQVLLTQASAYLWKVRVVVGWTDDGATAGTSGGIYDHSFALEVLRTVQEAM
jgi:prepilin-type N-terminal cleavage/methylation domain-containing protein